MPDYKAIHGKNILHLASDLDNSEGEGQIWFNTATSDYKTIIGVGAWASGGALNVGRYNAGGVGTSSATLLFGGFSTPPSTRHAIAETYDGSSWTEVGDLNTAKNAMGSM